MKTPSATTDLSIRTTTGSTVEPDETVSARAAVPRSLWPLGAYLAVSVVLFGLPVIAHPRSHIIAVDDLDPSVYICFLAWWPHALLHGLNPFVTHAIL